MHKNVEKLINDFAVVLYQDPMDQLEDTQAILRKFTQALTAETLRDCGSKSF